jgi:hypothetical protein
MHLVDHWAGKFQFTSTWTVDVDQHVVNVVPGDFDHDGRLDLLVMFEDEADDGGWWGGKGSDRVGMRLYLGGGEAGAPSESWLYINYTSADMNRVGLLDTAIFDAGPACHLRCGR